MVLYLVLSAEILRSSDVKNSKREQEWDRVSHLVIFQMFSYLMQLVKVEKMYYVDSC